MMSTSVKCRLMCLVVGKLRGYDMNEVSCDAYWWLTISVIKVWVLGCVSLMYKILCLKMTLVCTRYAPAWQL